MKKIEFPYSEICFDCARALNGLRPGIIGVWQGVCPVCREKKSLAAAGHDFGLYYVDKERLEKRLQEVEQKRFQIRRMIVLLEALKQ